MANCVGLWIIDVQYVLMHPGVVDTKINENDIPFLSLYVGTDARNAHRRVSSLPRALYRRKHPVIRETACECSDDGIVWCSVVQCQ